MEFFEHTWCLADRIWRRKNAGKRVDVTGLGVRIHDAPTTPLTSARTKHLWLSSGSTALRYPTAAGQSWKGAPGSHTHQRESERGVGFDFAHSPRRPHHWHRPGTRLKPPLLIPRPTAANTTLLDARISLASISSAPWACADRTLSSINTNSVQTKEQLKSFSSRKKVHTRRNSGNDRSLFEERNFRLTSLRSHEENALYAFCRVSIYTEGRENLPCKCSL